MSRTPKEREDVGTSWRDVFNLICENFKLLVITLAMMGLLYILNYFTKLFNS